MSRQQRNFNPSFKAKVALESIQGLRTISELGFCIGVLEEALCLGENERGQTTANAISRCIIAV